jgi:hypothetical protein
MTDGRMVDDRKKKRGKKEVPLDNGTGTSTKK